jgi:speckle-type POZ protein
MPGGKLVAVDIVGEPVLSEKHTIRVEFRNFANLPHDRGEETSSSALLCHGYQWELCIYPGGDDAESNKDTVYLSLYLICLSVERGDWEVKVKTKLAFRVPSANFSTDLDDNIFSNKEGSWGDDDFLPRANVLDPSKGFLVDGNLTVEVDIQVYVNKLPAFRPKATLNLDMMKFLESANKSGDVTFKVGSEEFPAHRQILEARVPELAAVAEDYSSDTLIHIQGVKPSTFRSLLRFVYADDAPKPEELQNEARELLDVANRFGCKGLKLLAEAELVESGITVDTAADLILIGDAKNCALLKEAAIDFFAKNAESVKSSTGWENITESAPIMKELIEVVDNNNQKRMRITTLRQNLEDKDLDVDGSREMLIQRLEKSEGCWFGQCIR